MRRPTPEQDSLGNVMRAGRDRLEAAGIEDPAIEAELLMRHALRGAEAPLPTKAWLLPRLGQTATVEVRERFEALLQRRLHHEPSAYIVGQREFYALEFEVTPDVLIPRPETELLVSAAVDWASGGSGHWATYPRATSQFFLQNGRHITSPITIVDVGTGSGAIAVALAHTLPIASVIATDLSWTALELARRNAARHGVDRRIEFRHGDLLMPVHCYVDLIVANLPYVRESDWRTLEPEVREHEPRIALAAGEDGLDAIRALLRQAPRYLRPGGSICLEFGIGQEGALIEETRASLPGWEHIVLPDFAGTPRVLVASARPRAPSTPESTPATT